MAGRPQQQNTHREIPYRLNEHSLNLRAFIDLPPQPMTLRDEIYAIVTAALKRSVSPEATTDAIVAVFGRREEEFVDAVRAAWPGCRQRATVGELYADGIKEDI